MKNLEHKVECSRSDSSTATFLRTCFNGINILTGIGLLSVPHAISAGGWVSLVFLFGVAIICWYTALLLKYCMDSDPLIENYLDMGERAFGNKGRALVSLFMNFEIYLLAVELLILEGDNLHKLFPNTDFHIGKLKIGGKQGFVVLTGLVILPTTWLRNLGTLAYVSAGGVLGFVVLIGCVLWVGVVDGVGFHEGDAVWNWRGLPTTTSVFAFCYSGHACFPTLYSSMKDRTKFSKVLIVMFVTSTTLYGSMAIIGYLMYGQHLKSQVTLNLPLNKISSQIAIYATVISPLAKYAIIVTPTAEAIEGSFHVGNNICLSILVRTMIVTSTVVVALTVPYFGYVMGFIGAFLGIGGSVLIPCICYLRINEVARFKGLDVVIIVGILVFGVVLSILGTYTSLKHIISDL